jgi:hypothetical protein
VDFLGKPSLDFDKFWEYIKKSVKEKRLAKQVKQGKNKANKKF